MKKIYLLLCFLIVMFVAGCPDRYIEVHIVRSVNSAVMDERISYGTEFLRHSLPVTRIATTQLNDGRVKAQVRVENVISGTLVTAYKFEWLDRDGIVASGSRWQEKVIFSEGSATLESSAPSVKYAEFKLSLRSAQPIKIVPND